MTGASMILAAGDAPSTYVVVSLLIILATAAFVAIVMQRVRLAVIPAYLIAGALIGPGALRLVRSSEDLDAISQLAIVLLMFGIGLHLHLSVFGKNVGRMIAAGIGSCALSILLGWPVAIAFGLSAPAALAVCMALSMSSTAVVLRLITDRGELRHATGQLALSILVTQDLLVLALLAALPVVARWAGTGESLLLPDQEAVEALPGWGKFIVDAVLRIAGVTLLVLIGKVVLPRLLSEAARERSGEVMMIVSIAIAIGAGLAMRAMGFSMELGAFLAGFMLSATQFRHHISGLIAPLRDLFMAVFFTALGMQLELDALAESWWIVLLGGFAMSTIKAIAIGGTCWALGATAAAAVAVGMALSQAGEFSLIFLDDAQESGILAQTATSNAIAIVVISLLLTPAMVDLGKRFSQRWQAVKPAPWIRRAIGEVHEQTSPRGSSGRHVILGGYGQVGSAIGRALRQGNVSFIVIEIEPSIARDSRHAGCNAILGDVSNPHILEEAGIEKADALILTMPNEEAVLNACAVARRRNSKIFIAVRMGVERHAKVAAELGADHITVEEVETAKAMQEAVMNRLAK
ncbi:MAG: cation:proton antiporter [Phycisphaerales bacterium]|nr:cation:proton antiporter [Phycisphaerales bacterium]MCI0630982.1 cation:proton antiporter [Phycisphaerales bacterium]MCI0676774.1 cation:proton antiporter [Phycisphaerales bacterium]